MKKMMRRLIALVMVLSLSTGMIALPAAAEESPAPEETTTVTVSVDVKDDSGKVIGEKTTTTTTSTSGTVTSEQTTTTTASDTGTVTSVQGSTSTTDSSGTLVSEKMESSTTQVEQSRTESGGTLTETDRNWNSSQTQYDPDLEKKTFSDDTTQTIEGKNQISVEGSSENRDTVEKDGKKTHYSGSETGSETTTTTDTTTITTVITGDLLHTQTEESELPGTFREGKYGTHQTTSGQWTRDPSKDVSGSWSTAAGSEETTEHKNTRIELPDPLETTDVTLEMKPDGNWVKEEISVSLKELIPGEGTQKDGSTVKHIKDGNGVVIGYTVTRYGSEITQFDDEIVESNTTDPIWNTTEEDTPVKPPEYPAVVAEDETTTVLVEEIKDDKGSVIGYKVVTTEVDVTDTDAALEGSASDDPVHFYTAYDIPEDAIPYGANSYIRLPAEPVTSVSTDENGTATEITAEEIKDDDGVTIGYRTITTVRDARGNLVSRSSVSEYGTRITFSSTRELDPDTRKVTTVTEQIITGLQDSQTASTTTSGVRQVVINRDAEQEIYNLVKTTSGYVFIYKGKMYEVMEMSGHGDISMSTVIPDLSRTPSGDGAVNESTDLRNPHYNDYADVSSGTISKGYDYKYVGYGLESAIQAQTGIDGTLVHQFKLVDKDGNAHYVLCADYNTSAVRGADYSMENVADADYYEADTAKKIQSIVYNGFWGTSSGAGSLNTVKEFLKENSNVSDSILNGLTEGEALTATQAALWYYANSSGSNIMSSTDAAYKEYTGNYNNGWTLEGLSTEEVTRVNALYQALINQNTANADSYSTELIDQDNFARSSTLVIKEKATDASGNVKTDSNNNEKYVADLTFTLDVQKSDLTGNLKIYVRDEKGNVLAERQLATDDSNFVGNLLAEDSVGSGSYTITDIELAENVKFSLSIEGTQNLALGAYLYSAEVYSTSQTFVGLGSGTHSVDLQVNMEFSVTEPEDPTLSHTTKNWTEGKINQEAYTRSNILSRSRTGTQTETTVTVTTDLYGTRTYSDTVTAVTKVEKDWESYYEYTETEPSGGRDEDQDPADPPKTGDTTLILALVSLFSGGGLVLLNRKKEEL